MLEPLAFVHALVTRVAPGPTLLTVQQPAGLCHIVDVGGCTNDAVHQTAGGIHADVRLHNKAPLIGLLGLMHLWVVLTALVLGLARCSNDGSVHHSASL